MQYLLSVLAFFHVSSAFSADSLSPAESREQMKKRVRITDTYVHEWTPFPEVIGKSVFSSAEQRISPKKGRAMAVWLLAHYSEDSQQILPKILQLQQKYEKLFTDFVFVFVNDQLADARGSANEFGITGNVLVGEEAFKKAFKNEQPPAVFFADRHGWLNWMEFKLDDKKLTTIDNYLAKLNVM